MCWLNKTDSVCSLCLYTCYALGTLVVYFKMLLSEAYLASCKPHYLPEPNRNFDKNNTFPTFAVPPKFHRPSPPFCEVTPLIVTYICVLLCQFLAVYNYDVL